MEEKTYLQKLQDPRWQRKRLEVMQRDEFMCQHCGANDKPLSIHHIAYNFNDPWEIENQLLISLCGDCHEAETIAVKAAFGTLIQNMKLCGFMAADVELFSTVFLGQTIIDQKRPTLLDLFMQTADSRPGSNYKHNKYFAKNGHNGTK